MSWTVEMSEDHVVAPDGSEVRPLAQTTRGSMAHCTLPPGGVSLAVRHRTVEEVWFFISGAGEVWRKHGDREEVVAARPGTSIAIPTGAHFQFRTVGDAPLVFLLTTMPPWPGHEEAERVADFWPTDAPAE